MADVLYVCGESCGWNEIMLCGERWVRRICLVQMRAGLRVLSCSNFRALACSVFFNADLIPGSSVVSVRLLFVDV